MTTEYIAYHWPEYQEYMGEEWFRKECYYCADKDVYFIPINRVNTKEEILAWLEKQDKNNKPLYIRFGDIPKDEKSKVYNGEIEIGTEKGVSVYPAFEDLEGNIVLGLSLPVTKTSLYTQQHLLEYDNRACYLVSGDYIGKGTDGEPLLRNIKIIREIKDFRVKQGEQETLCDKCRKEHPSHSCQDITELGRCSVEHEQKSDNSYCQENCKGFQETGKCFADGYCKAKRKAKSIYEVKPKFKVGDWICNDMCDVHIASIENGMYYFDEGDGLSIVFVDEHYHLWTIEDAMDGDVLTWDDTTCVVLFKNIKNNNCFISYCFANDISFEIGVSHYIEDCHPATKEQRDLLFQKMEEAGWEFDFEKKELKKIENKIEIPFGAKDSELQEAIYYIPKGFHAEIDNDKVVIKKGEKPTILNENSERIIKHLISLVNEVYNNTNYITFLEHKELLAWLEKLDDNIEL